MAFKDTVSDRSLLWDEGLFASLCERLRVAGGVAVFNQFVERFTQPSTALIATYPSVGDARFKQADALGHEMLAKGCVAPIILAGGMSTRYGSTLKAAECVWGNETFLSLRLRDIARYMKSAWLMANPLSAPALDVSVKQLSSVAHTHIFLQRLLPRIDIEGRIVHDEHGDASLCATGHGDLIDAVHRTGVVEQLKLMNVKYVVVSNIDNLGATVDPVVIGAHVLSGNAVTVEVVKRHGHDAGGIVAEVDERVQILESFRFDSQHRMAQNCWFNTNSMVLNVDALADLTALPWRVVTRPYKERTVLQFERLLGELTTLTDVHWLEVARDGIGSRFIPVKAARHLQMLGDHFMQRLVGERFGVRDS